MQIKSVSVVVQRDDAQDNDTQGIIEVLEALPILDSTSVIVTDSALSAMTFLAETLSNTERTLLKESDNDQLMN